MACRWDTRSAFAQGFADGSKADHYLSARETMEMHPDMPGGAVDAYLNGADDGLQGDTWRINQPAGKHLHVAWRF